MTLDQCCEIVSGATPKTSAKEYWDGDICWTTPKDLSNLETHYLEDTPRKITKLGLDSCGASILPSGSVLFSSRAPIGHVAINAVPMATNQGFKSFIPKTGILDAKFLFHWLRKNRDYLESLGNGATFKEVSKATVSRIEITFPAIANQRRIAAILDQADALRAKRREALTQLDSLTQSIFMEMFGDPATNPMSWPVRTIEQLCKVKGGKRLPKGADYSVSPTPFRYVRVTDMKSGKVDESNLHYLTPEVQRTISRYIVNTGDVIISIAGSIGVIATVSNSLNGANLTENAAKLVARTQTDYISDFLAFMLRTKAIQSQIESHVGQVTIGKLALFRIEKLLMPLPPLQLQKTFATRIQAVEGLKDLHRTALQELDALFASLQHRAFQGEL
ncbi:restriction endonuclease subunit S [Polaromonas sp.]|uniref:restriction endonuclease subunit S n=1 Tax=Polaromonas sp. TaxID=1869339 RepID=UPI003BB4D386